MTNFAEQVARNVSLALAKRAQETGEQVERMLAREQADIRSAIETKSSVDGKASVPRLRQQEKQRALTRAAEGAAEVARELAAEVARAAR